MNVLQPHPEDRLHLRLHRARSVILTAQECVLLLLLPSDSCAPASCIWRTPSVIHKHVENVQSLSLQPPKAEVLLPLTWRPVVSKCFRSRLCVSCYSRNSFHILSPSYSVLSSRVLSFLFVFPDLRYMLDFTNALTPILQTRRDPCSAAHFRGSLCPNCHRAILLRARCAQNFHVGVLLHRCLIRDVRRGDPARQSVS
jgi:hypothetical protein